MAQAPSPAGDHALPLLARVAADPLALEELDEAPELVPQLPPQTFAHLARRLDEESRLDLLLPHATGEQLTALMDLDAWRDDRLDPRRARLWLDRLSELRHGGELARGRLVRTIYGMDPELWSLALHPGLVIQELDPDDDEARFRAREAVADMAVFETPDGGFLVAAPADGEGARALAILSRVYDDSLTDGAALVRSIAALVPAMAEDELLRWRRGRLADMGFVAWEDAMKLLRPLPPAAAWSEAPRPFTHLVRHEPDDAAVAPPLASGLLRRVLDRLDPGEHGLRAREFMLLANEVLSAQRLDPGEPVCQRRALEQTQATLNLGLEVLLRARPDLADPEGALAERVQAIGLRDVFRVGYGPIAALRKAAEALHRQGRVSLVAPGSLLDRPWGPALRASLALFPTLPPPDPKVAAPPVGSLADLAGATARLAQAGALAHLAFAPEGLGVDPVWLTRADTPERLHLGDLIRTALVLRLRHGPGASFAPLEVDDLAWAQRNLLERRALIPAVSEELRARLQAVGQAAHARALVPALAGRLEVELATLEPGEDAPVDLASVGGLLTVQSVAMWLSARHPPGAAT